MSGIRNIQEAIRKRYSCRTYSAEPLQKDHLATLSEFLETLQRGPFGSSARFSIIASTHDDQHALKGLGAYGSVKDPQAFLVGAIETTSTSLEEYGYLVEQAVLKATELGIGTCWIGGIFTRSRFAERIQLSENEHIPAIVAMGYESEDARNGFIRRTVKGFQRLQFEQLFFDTNYGTPIQRDSAQQYTQPLEMLRLAPSASNKQPWRVVRQERSWHFYLQRTKGYGKGSLLFSVLRLPDLQRVDMGIAMCHFEFTARALGLHGSWIHHTPPLAHPESAEYIVTWIEE